jgi:hypothetical protein
MARRGIPPLRKWQVRYWFHKQVVFTVTVDAVNKDFAKFNASRVTPFSVYQIMTKLTVSLVRS